MTKTFWEKLEGQQGTDGYFGPFHRLAMYRGRGGDYTHELRKARETRKEKPDAPGHWLEFYNVYLDTFSAHEGSSNSQRKEVYSTLQDGVTAIPVSTKHDELDLLSRIYHHCHEPSGSRQTADGVARRILSLFSNSICERYNWVTANQCSFLVPVIAAHFLWAMRKDGIKIPDLYEGLRSEQHQEGIYSHALKLYAQRFIRHFIKSFGRWYNEESFFYALKLLASNQFEKSAKIESFYQSWHKSSNNAIVLKESPVSKNHEAGVEIIYSTKLEHHKRQLASQEEASDPPLSLDKKTREEHTKNHRTFWGKVGKSKSPFTLLSSCHYQPEGVRLSENMKAYFRANKARKKQPELAWSFFEVFDKLCDILMSSIKIGGTIFNQESIQVAFGDKQFSSDDASINVLVGMHKVLSGDEVVEAISSLRKALKAGFHSYNRARGYRQYDDVMAFFATAKLLHQLSKAKIDGAILLSHLDDKELRSSVSLYACQFMKTVVPIIIRKEASLIRNDANLSAEWLAKVLMGKLPYSQSLHEQWSGSEYNSVDGIEECLNKLLKEAVREENASTPNMDQPSTASTPQSPHDREERFEEIDLGPAINSREQFFSKYLKKIKAETYWTPVRIAVSICLPFMAIWFLIESCLNRHGIKLREKALTSEENIGWKDDSAFRKPRHLHHAIWTGLTGCCRHQPVETRAIREFNQSQISS